MDVRIQTVLKRIECDIACTPAPRALAAEVKLSLSHFYDLFRRETGTVPARYIRALRFQKAQELLVRSQLSVKEIAGLVGIHDVSHFVRDFQKMHGISPREFRRAYARIPVMPHTFALQLEKAPTNRNSRQ